jgi:hypothetical protein
MSQDLIKVEEGLRSLRLDRLAEFTKKIEDISKGFNTMLAPVYLRDFIMAYDFTNTMYASSVRMFGIAEAEKKTAEAIAYFENAPDYLESKGVKDTDAARKRYVDMDPAVVHANKVRAQAESMMIFLRNKLQEFRLAHDDVKKIAYANEYNNDSPNESM